MTDPIEAPCRQDHLGVVCGGQDRDVGLIRLAVVHSTEGYPRTAEQAAAYLHSRPDGSAHLVLDSEGCYRLAWDAQTACGVRGLDERLALHLEMTALSSWQRLVWLQPKHRRMLNRAAWRVALWCRQHGLPVAYVDPDGVKAGRRGWTTHRALTASGTVTSTHKDPGPWFPRWWFARAVRRHHRDIAWT